MTQSYIKRSLESVLARTVAEFPAVVLTGPRQSGKTTLLKHLFGRNYRYVSLEAPDVRAAAAEDPRGFLEMYPAPVIFDEVQHAPELLPYIKEKIDTDRGRKGQYLLTGSQHILMMERITESLAGRTAVLKLLPLSRRESEGRPDYRLPWQTRKHRQAETAPTVSVPRIWNDLLRGSYPEPVIEPGRDIQLWHSAYVQTYLERDVRTMRQVGDLSQFQSFLRAVAARSAQLLNLAELARDLGIAVNTAKAWLSVLEAGHQIVVLRPYFADIGKRLVKTPKVYFTDTGTLCYLTGLRNPEHAAAGPMGGAIMETAVFSEIIKTITHQGVEPEIYFWRTSAGTEVDFVVPADGKLVPIEVKLSATPRREMARAIHAFQEDLGDLGTSGYVIHPGGERLPIAPKVTALPFWEL